jgi:hypothetical protein
MPNRNLIASLPLIVTSSMLLASCACGPVPPVPANYTVANAIVQGLPASLTVFDQKLKAIVGVANLENDAFIGCLECSQLSDPQNPPTQLTYLFVREQKPNYCRFGRAWNAAQMQTADPTLTLTFDPNVPPPDCSLYRQPCYPAPICQGNGSPTCSGVPHGCIPGCTR